MAIFIFLSYANRPFPSYLCVLCQNSSSSRRMCSMQLFFHAHQAHFHMKDFAQRLKLKQRHKVTCKWTIQMVFFCPENGIHNLRLHCIIFSTPPDQSVPDKKTLDSFSTSRFHLRPSVHVERDLDPNQVLIKTKSYNCLKY